MPGHYDQKASGGIRFDERHVAMAHPLVRSGSAFVLGLITGLFLKAAAKRMYDGTRGRLWHSNSERTVTYDDNLPNSLSRREPVPQEKQPRYGGTGAIGVSPAAVLTPQVKATESAGE